MRPSEISGMAGNERAKQIISSKTAETMPKAILICGDPGTGKTTLARIILENILGCSDECLSEINMGTRGGVETARTIEDEVHYHPGTGNINGWILDECHKATTAAISGLLKPTEDGSPDFNYFIFCTSDRKAFLKKLTKTEEKAFLRRCMEIEVECISDDDGYNMLDDCLMRLDISGEQVSDNVIEEILKISGGVPAVMYKNLEAVVDLESCDHMIEYLKLINVTSEEAAPEIKDLCSKILKGNWAGCIGIVSDMRKKKIDVDTWRFPMMGYMLSVMLSPQADKITADRAMCCIDELEKPLHEGRIYKFYAIVRKACLVGQERK